MSEDKFSKEKQEFELKKLEFEKAIDLRNFEIDNFWKRGWFFGALLTALIGAYIALKKDGYTDFALCISFIALLVALFQALMNRGSKYWQERWEYVVKNKEAALKINLTKARNPNLQFVDDKGKNQYFERGMIDICILAKNEGFLTRSARLSVSKLTFLIWDLLAISCFSIWLKEFLSVTVNIEEISYAKNVELIVFHLVIIGYVIVFFNIQGKIYEPLTTPENYLISNPQGESKYYDLSEFYVNDTNHEEAKKIFKEGNNKYKK
ncbi:MAG: hypothetical protein ABI203_03275 [Mucilaginibacter sp.]